MKTMFQTFTAVALIAFSCVLNAQELSRPLQKSLLPSGTTPYLIAGSFTTNIPAATAPIIPFTKNGLGVFFRVGATNAATTTNATVVFEQVLVTSDGIVQVIDNAPNTFTVSVPQNGTTGADYYTNMVSTLANFPNSLVRIRSIQNTNLASIWISNAVATAQQ